MKKLNYFITGGTGSFGKEFIINLLKKKMASKIIIFSRDEFKQLKLKEDATISKHLKNLKHCLFSRKYIQNCKESPARSRTGPGPGLGPWPFLTVLSGVPIESINIY